MRELGEGNPPRVEQRGEEILHTLGELGPQLGAGQELADVGHIGSRGQGSAGHRKETQELLNRQRC